MLSVRDLDVRYDDVPALKNVSLEVKKGQVVAVIGANGAGKSTLLRTISGLQPVVSGSIEFENDHIDRLPAHDIVRKGLVQVPEGRGVFAQQSVLRNLQLGAFLRKKEEQEQSFEEVFELFPRLKERINQRAGTLSGGEQQMLAIGRGLMARPKLLMLDEPSLGLSPKLIDLIFETIQKITTKGLTILIVAQNVRDALELADQGYVLQTGRVVLEGTGKELLQSDLVRQAYLGL